MLNMNTRIRRFMAMLLVLCMLTGLVADMPGGLFRGLAEENMEDTTLRDDADGGGDNSAHKADPADTKPASDASSDTPAGTQPANDTPADAPADTEPGSDAPADVPAAAQPGSDAPADAPADTEPGSDAPADAPAEAQPGSDAPADAPAAAQPANDAPTDAPAEAQPANDAPADAPAAAQPGSDAPADAPAEAQPANDVPGDAPAEAQSGSDILSDSPIEGQPTIDNPEETQPAEAQPGSDAPADVPNDIQPGSDAPADTSTDTKPAIDTPSNAPIEGRPTADNPEETQPSDTQSTSNAPADTLAAAQPGRDAPAGAPAETQPTGDAPADAPAAQSAEEDEEAQPLLISEQAIMLAATVAEPAMTGGQSESQANNSTGNTAKDMANSVEFQDPLNPSNNPVTITTLQKMIEEKLASTSTLSGTMTMELGRNTTYSGDIALRRVNLGTVTEDFTLELASEDAGSDGLSADGSTVLDGNMVIEGLRVTIKGVRMALNKVVSVLAGVDKINGDSQPGSLEYYGTTAADVITVDAGKDGSAVIDTGAGDDRVGLNTSNSTESTVVRTGEGDDTVYAFIYGGSSEIDTGAGNDEAEVYVYEPQPEGSDDAPISIDMGAGNDQLQLALTGSASVSAITGEDSTRDAGAVEADGGKTDEELAAGTAFEAMAAEDDDSVVVYGRYGAGNLTLKTGDGSDAVEVKKNYGAPDLVRVVPNIAGIDQLEITSTADTVNPAPAAVMDIDLGGGNNRADIDMSIGDNFAQILLSGKTPHRVHLTGALNPELGVGATPIAGDSSSLTFQTEHGNALEIRTTARGVEHHFTDDLKNKTTLYVYGEDAKNGTTTRALRNFVDYVLKVDPSSIDTVAPFAQAEGGDTLLTNLVIDADQINIASIWREHDVDVPWGGEVKLNNVVADRVNLLVRANDIVFKGRVVAKEVMAYAHDGTTASMDEVMEMDNLVSDTIEMLVNLQNAYHSAGISVKEGAQIISEGDVDLVADADGTGSALSLLPNFMNLLNIKLIGAKVEVDGDIWSGYRAGVADDPGNAENYRAWKDGYGSTLLRATARSMMGYKAEVEQSEATKASTGYNVPYLSASPMLLSVNFANNMGIVRVGEKGGVTAAGDVKLRGGSEVRSLANATTGMFTIPVALAAAAINSIAKAEVLGDVRAGGNVLVDAEGIVRSTVLASRAADQSRSHGVFITAHVVVQNAVARIGYGGLKKPGDGAESNAVAGGHVRVRTDALEDVRTTAASSVDYTSSPTSMTPTVQGMGGFAKSIFLWIPTVVKKHKYQKSESWDIFDFSAEGDDNALDAMVNGLSASPYSYEVIQDSSDESGGTISLPKVQTVDSRDTIIGSYEEKDGKTLAGVVYRYLEPNKSKYTVGTAAIDRENRQYSFEPPKGGITGDIIIEAVFADGDGSGASSSYPKKKGVTELSLHDMLNAAVYGVAANKGDKKGEDEERVAISLITGEEGDSTTFGRLVTKECYANGECYLKTRPGEAVEIVPNPAKGYELVDETMVVRYYLKGSTKQTVATVQPDSEGRYIVNVPSDINESRGIQVSGSFEKIVKEEEGPHKQVFGALGFTIAVNHSVAEAGDAATVRAGTGVDIDAGGQTRVQTLADGTPVSDQQAAQMLAKAKKLYDRPAEKLHTEYTVGSAKHALRLSSSSGGRVERQASGGTEDGIHYKFRATPDAGMKVARVVVTYYQGEEQKTKVLSPDVDDENVYSLDLTALGEYGTSTVDNGTVVHVGFLFEGDGDSENLTEGADGYVVRNAIAVRTNVLNKDSIEDAYNLNFTRIGSVYFLEEKDGKYWFKVKADEDAGYTIDSINPDVTHPERSNTEALYASYVDGGGITRRAPLLRDVAGELGVWYLDPGRLAAPEGAIISVCAKFTAQTYDIKVKDNPDPELAHGTVQLDASQVMKGDEVSIIAAPDPGYSLDNAVVVRYRSSVTGSLGWIEKEVMLDGSGAGTFKFDKAMYVSDDSTIEVIGTFRKKDIELHNDSSVTLSESFVSPGQTVGISLPEDKVQAGYRLNQVTLVAQSGVAGRATAAVSNGQFEIPAEYRDAKYIMVSATGEDMALKDIPIEASGAITSGVAGSNVGGSLTPATARADIGETVAVRVTPNSGCKLKEGTAVAVLKLSGEDREIKLKKQSQNVWTFTVPSDVDWTEIGTASISLKAEFEEGKETSAGDSFSAGVAIGLQGVNAETRAQVLDAEVAARDLRVRAQGSGTDTLTARAGYSQGDIGVGGAVAVQVSVDDTAARIAGDARIALSGTDDRPSGLEVIARSGQSFDLTADSGAQTPSGKTGVGAAIALGVRLVDAQAGVGEGAKLTARRLGGVDVQAKQSISETVTARAGSAGGYSVTPVLATNVFISGAEAAVGRLDGGGLIVHDIGITAVNDARHVLSANGTAAGREVGIGGAFGISVVLDSANAGLDNAVMAVGNISVASTEKSTVFNTTVSGASGGRQGTASESGASGSADRQVDRALAGASSIAPGGKSSGASSSALNRQKAQTTEGSVAGAAAYAVNVLLTASKAKVGDVDLIATGYEKALEDGTKAVEGGAVSVLSINRTHATVKSNASATKSDVGIGVGVAVNVVNIDNIASVGAGGIVARSLEVVARMPDSIGSQITNEQRVTAPKTTDAFVKELQDFIIEATKVNDELNWLPAELLAVFAGNFANALLEELGLKEYLGEGGIEAKLSRAQDMFTQTLEKLKKWPEALMGPVIRLLQDAEETMDMTSEDWEGVLDSVVNDLILWMPDEFLAAVEQTAMSVMYTLGGDVLDFAENRLRRLPMPTKEEFLHSFTNLARDAIFTGLELFINDLVEEAVTLLSAQLPILSRERLDYLLGQLPDSVSGTIEKGKQTAKWLKSDDLMTSIGDGMQSTAKSLGLGIVDYVLDSFRANVFDYEKVLIKLYDTDIITLLKDTFEDALKAGTVAMTNEAISKLVNALDLSLQPEGTTDKHYVYTQATSGAGAETMGVAGAVAVTVLLSDTNAAVKGVEGGGAPTLDIADSMLVDARETRRVTNNASAAVDAKGQADINDRAGGAQSADVGGGSDAGTSIVRGRTTVKTSAGGRAAFDVNDTDRVNLIPDEGYDVNDDFTLNYTYTPSTGGEKTGTVEIKVDENDNWYFNLSDAGVSMAGDPNLLFEVEFAEFTRPLPELTYETTDENQIIPIGTFALGVEGRTKKDGKCEAKAGDTVMIRYTHADGINVAGLSYTYEESGKKVKVPVTMVKSSSAKETIYAFIAPDHAIYDITVELGDPGQASGQSRNKSKTQSRDEGGSSVGVGASVAIIFGNSDVKARVGARDIAAGSLKVNAANDHQEYINAVAGTDPLQSGRSGPTTVKDYSGDAAVALNVLDNDILAEIAAGGSVRTTALTGGDMSLTASETETTWIRSSGFATGGNVAVGASAALNLGFTNVKAALRSDAVLTGSAKIDATSHSEDKTSALSTAMGADIQRYLDKFAGGIQATQDVAQSVMDGSIIDKVDQKLFAGKNTKNGTANRVNNRLNERSTGEDAAGNSQNTSVNALKTQDVKTPDASGAKDATDIAAAETAEGTGQSVATSRDTGDPSKVQIAAAVGFTLTTHDARSVIAANISAGEGISATAGNSANFNTLGTGAAMSLADKANSVAAAVALSASGNKAVIDVSGDMLANRAGVGGDVTLSANLTQNMDGEYRGKLAAQSLAGAVSGADSTVSIGGAISVVLSRAVSDVRVKSAENGTRRLSGDMVTVSADDKSKLAIRAGGVSLSKGSTVGLGLAGALILSENEVNASIGDDAEITAKDFNLTATKHAVTFDDYAFPLSLKNAVSDSSKLNDDQRQNVETGIIDVRRGADDDSYTVEINVRSTDVLKVFDAMNFLSSTNYYAEAIAGSVVAGGAGSGKLSVAGSAAVAVFFNKVTASLGKDAKVILARDGDHEGSMNLSATGETNARMIAGAISAGKTKVAGGLSFALVNDDDEIKSKLGDGAVIEAEGDVNQTANAEGDILLVNAAATGAVGSDAKAALGGSLNALHAAQTADALVGSGVKIAAGGALNVRADTDLDLMAFAASLNGTTAKAAAGGTILVVVDQAESRVDVGSGHELVAKGDVSIGSFLREQLISGIASASVALSSGGAAVAGNLAVLVSLSKARTSLEGGRGGIESTAGSVAVDADSDTRMINAMVSAAGGTGVAVGVNLGVNVFGRIATLDIEGADSAGDYAIRAKQDVVTRAAGRDLMVTGGLALSAGTGSGAASGTFVTSVSRSKIRNAVEKAMTVKAENNAAFDAYHSGIQVMVGGALGVTTGSAGVAATVVNMVHKNNVQTTLGRSAIEAQARGGGLTVRNGAAISGIHVGAKSAETQVVVGVGVAGGSSAGVTGTLVTATAGNTVRAKAEQASLCIAESSGRGDVNVFAVNDIAQGVGAGGANGSGTAAVGASVVSQVNISTVEALAGDIAARGDISVRAQGKELYVLAAISAGGAGTAAVEIGAAIQVLMSTVRARQSGAVTGGGDYTLDANQNANIIDVVGAIAGSGTAAVTPVGVVTYAKGVTEADLAAGASVTLKNAGRAARIHAKSDKDLYQYIVGAAASGVAAVSGSVAIAVGQEKVSALAREGATLNLGGSDLDVDARNAYAMQSVTAAVGIGGTAGVAVNAAVNVMMDTTTAALDSVVKDARDVKVDASSDRDVVSVIASVTGSVTASVGVSLLAFAAGSRMSQDAADMLTYGNAPDKSGDIKTFDAAAFLKTAAEQGAQTDEVSDLADVVSGNGYYYTQQKVGQGGDFDATSGLVSEDFNKKGFDDANSETQRGENHAAVDSQDVASAKQFGVYDYKHSPSDVLTARIGSSAVVEAKNAEVNALQNTRADLYGGTATASGVAGVGVTTALAVLYSNVLASSTGAVALRDGTLSVNAESRSDKVAADTQEEKNRASALKTTVGDILNPANRSLRAVALTGAVGITGAGVGVSAALVLTDNQTKALLGGTASGIRNLNVKSGAHYTDVLAVSVAASGGLAAVSGAAAVALADGSVDAVVDSGASVSRAQSSGSGAYAVTTDSSYSVNALCAAVGMGVGGANVGVAAAGSRLKQNALIREGAAIDKAGAGSIAVTGKADVVVDAWVIGAGVTGIGVNPLGAVALAGPQVTSRIGGDAGKVVIRAEESDIRVANDVYSKVLPVVGNGNVSLAGINCNALVAYSEVKSAAEVVGTAMNARSLDIQAKLDTTAEADVSSMVAAGTALGLSVEYAEVGGWNRALLDVSEDMKLTNGVSVTAGAPDELNNALARAIAVSASIGAVSGSANAAAARNLLENTAGVKGGGKAKLDVTGSFTVDAGMKAKVEAEVIGIDIGGAVVAPSVAVAIMEAQQFAKLSLTRLEQQNRTNADRVTLRSTLDANSDARLITGGGSVSGARSNTAVAYGRSKSVIEGALTGDARVRGGFDVLNNAVDDVRSRIDNQTFTIISANAMVGVAYSQDTFDTKLILAMSGGKLDVGKEMNVVTNYGLNTAAEVTPSAAGVQVGGAQLDVNVAVAKASAKVDTGLSGHAVLGAKEVSVRTQGYESTKARIVTPNLVVANFVYNPNVTYARDITKQTATLGGSENGALTLAVSKSVNVAAERNGNSQKTQALLGGSGWDGGDSKVSVSGAQIRVNTATALDDATAVATAQWLSADGANKPAVNVTAGGTSVAQADTGSENVATLAGVGVNVVKARAAAAFRARLLNPVALTVGSTKVESNYSADASAAVGASPTAMSLFGSDKEDIADAQVTATGEALVDLTGSNGDLTASKLDVTARGGMTAKAEGKTPTVSLDGVLALATHEVSATAAGTLSASLLNGAGKVRTTGDLSVLSQVTSSDVKAIVSSPKNAASVSLIGSHDNTATASEKIRSTAELGSRNPGPDALIAAGGGLTVRSLGADLSVRAETATPTAGGLMTGGNLASSASSKDSFVARVVGGRVESDGDIAVASRSNVAVESIGSSPGAYTLASGSSSTMNARVGSSGSRQTALVEIDGSLSGKKAVDIAAENITKAKSSMNHKTNFTLESVNDSSIPTTSWLKTGVSVLDGASIEAADGVTIRSSDREMADSVVRSDVLGIALNVAKMRGNNTVNTNNNISVGKNASISSDGDVGIYASSDAVMTAVSEYDGGWAIVHTDGNVEARNTLTRTASIVLGDGVAVKSGKEGVRVEARTGAADDLYTSAYTDGGALVNAISTSRSYLDVDSTAQVSVGGNASIWAAKDVALRSDASLNNSTYSAADTGHSGSSSARAEAYVTAKNHAKLLMNSNREGTLDIGSENRDVKLLASSEDVFVLADTYAKTQHYAGKGNALSSVDLDVLKHIYIDNTTVTAENGRVDVRSYNSDTKRKVNNDTYDADVLMVSAYTQAESVDGKGIIGGWGYAKSDVRLTGKWTNEIRSKQRNGGYNDALYGATVNKKAESPHHNLGIYMTNDTDATWRTDEKNEETYSVSYGNRNDLLTLAEAKSTSWKSSSTAQTTAKVLDEGFSLAENSDTVEDMWRSGSARDKGARNPGEIYVLELRVILSRDARMSLPDRYRLWRNIQTQEDVYLLPNATRLAARGYTVRTVQEMMSLTVDGRQRTVDVVVGLLGMDGLRHRLGVGYRSSIDYTDGILRIPEGESFWLYTSELSGAWLVDQFAAGTFRIDALDRGALAARQAGRPLPEGERLYGLIPAREDADEAWYWIGRAPGDAGCEAGSLYLLTWNRAGDEARIWRVDADGVETGMTDDPADFAVEQKAFAFRSLQADREREEVVYDVLMLDAGDGARSTVEFVTDLLEDRTLQKPSPLYVALRAFTLDGADEKCYRIRDVLFAFVDASDGSVKLLNGQYTATYVGGTFDSPYTRIENNGSAGIVIILKSGQPTWPEWMTPTSARDLEKGRYTLTDEGWAEDEAVGTAA